MSLRETAGSQKYFRIHLRVKALLRDKSYNYEIVPNILPSKSRIKFSGIKAHCYHENNK
jgi:hypothetical protein